MSWEILFSAPTALYKYDTRFKSHWIPKSDIGTFTIWRGNKDPTNIVIGYFHFLEQFWGHLCFFDSQQAHWTIGKQLYLIQIKNINSAKFENDIWYVRFIGNNGKELSKHFETLLGDINAIGYEQMMNAQNNYQ